jgi:transcriptional regulator with XRE-family HTH domain
MADSDFNQEAFFNGWHPRLIELFNVSKMSKEEFGNKIGMSKENIDRLLDVSKPGIPNPLFLSKILRVLDTSLEYLFLGQDRNQS